MGVKFILVISISAVWRKCLSFMDAKFSLIHTSSDGLSMIYGSASVPVPVSGAEPAAKAVSAGVIQIIAESINMMDRI
jgi:hypothetical protein